MSELDDVRKQYPEYQDWSDRELADALKDKYYPDMGDDEYYSQLGLDPNPGLAGVGRDVLEGVANLRHIPAGLAHLVSEAPAAIEGVAEMAPKRFGQNLAAGFGELGRRLLNVPSNVVEYGKKKELLPDWVQAWKPSEHIENFDYKQGVGLGEAQSGDALVQALPELVGFGAASEFGNAGKIARAGQRAAAFGTQAIVNENNPVTAALAGPAMEAFSKLLKGGKNIAKNLDLTTSGRIAKSAEGLLSPEELAGNLRAAQGTNTGLGNVIGSPQLAKKLSGEILPASTIADETLNTTRNQLGERATDIATKGAKNPGDANELTKSLLNASYKQTRDIKNTLYKDIEKISAAENFNLELPKFQQEIGKNISQLLESPMLQADAELAAGVQELMGAGAKKPTIKGAKIIASKFDSEASALKNPDATSRALKGLYQRAAKTLRDDVKEQISTKGSDALKKSFGKAEEFYSDEFTQFLERDVHKLLDEAKDPQTLVHEVIKPSKVHDKHTLIDKVTEILPEGQKDLLGNTYLSRAIGKDGIASPAEVDKLIKALGNRQFKSLFPDAAEREALLDFQRLKNMNTEAINRWFDPKTGNRNNAMLSKLYKAAVGGGKGYGAGLALEATLGIPYAKEIGGLIGAGGKTLNANRMAKLLTSEKFRDKVVEKLQNKKASASGGGSKSLMPQEFSQIVKLLVSEETAKKGDE